MYEAFWGLSEPPFNLTPDPRFLFMSKQHEEALSMLRYSISRDKGATMLTGDIGLGKTTLTRKLVEGLDPLDWRVVQIVNPILTPLQFLREILGQLGEPNDFRDRQQYASFLRKVAIEHFERGVKLLVIVDEAHLIRNSLTFEELRLVLNFELNDVFPLSLVLVGQPELRQKLARVPALDQRIAVRHTLKPLDVTQTGELLLHRLRVAGYTSDQSPFSPDAVYLLHRYSNGIPRMATQLADSVLLSAFQANQRIADAFLMHSIICDHAGYDVLLKQEVAA